MSHAARVTEFCHNSNITDSYFVKIYLCNATLTGFSNGAIHTAEARVYACVHFDPSDPRIFDLSSLCAPDPDSHVSSHEDAALPNQQSPTSTTTTATHFPSNQFALPPVNVHQ